MFVEGARLDAIEADMHEPPKPPLFAGTPQHFRNPGLSDCIRAALFRHAVGHVHALAQASVRNYAAAQTTRIRQGATGHAPSKRCRLR